ncbi:TRAP transporter small permease [Lentilitoribacter sp. EG35]|uniref:TRAP transporter small permease n=1 Tax=Lentilitoribacter sp. EG35 TaxID=3234192 RepID=UPI00346035B2
MALSCAVASALGMVAIVVIIVTSVMMRKFANTPIHITEEVVGLLLSVSLFLGLPMVTMKANHVRVGLLVDLFSGKLRQIVQIAALLVGLIFFGWLIIESIPWFEFAFKRNLKTETSRILLYPWMALMPFSLTLTGLIFLAHLLGIISVANDHEIDEQPSLISETS